MRLLVALFSFVLTTPVWAAAEVHPPGEHAKEAAQVEHGAPHTAADCESILASHEPHESDPEVSEYIFHHVSDSHVVAFESPFEKRGIALDFKKLECKVLGWNGVVHVGGKEVDLTPTKHTFWMWVAALVLVGLFWAVAPKKGQIVSRGLASFLEILVVFVRDDIARKNIPDPKEAERYTPYLLTCFFFIFTMNLLGLIPYCASATSNVAVTLGLALLTFLLTQAASIRSAGVKGYLHHLTGGVHPALWIIMVPVEFLSLFTKPFALTVRLFANMVAGHIVIFFLLGLIFILKSAWLALVSVPFAFGIYLLELFVALVQAFVFTLLSALFIGLGVAMGHHEAHEEPTLGEEGAKHVVHH